MEFNKVKLCNVVTVFCVMLICSFLYFSRGSHNATDGIFPQTAPLDPPSRSDPSGLVYEGRILPAGLFPLKPWRNVTGNYKHNDTVMFLSHGETINVECRERGRMGHIGDGGWDVCLAGPYRPKPPCLVYSFGINKSEHIRGERIHFYPIGLWGKDTSIRRLGEVRTLDSLVKLAGDEHRTIDILKFDIETSEWSVLPQMVQSGYIAKHVRQVAMETHVNMIPYARRYLATLTAFEALGFRKWHSHRNHNTYVMNGKTLFPKCLELYYLNMNFLEKAK